MTMIVELVCYGIQTFVDWLYPEEEYRFDKAAKWHLLAHDVERIWFVVNR